MACIQLLQILEDKPDQSRWTLKYEILGRDVEFSWLARNMTVSTCYELWQSCSKLWFLNSHFLLGTSLLKTKRSIGDLLKVFKIGTYYTNPYYFHLIYSYLYTRLPVLFIYQFVISVFQISIYSTNDKSIFHIIFFNLALSVYQFLISTFLSAGWVCCSFFFFIIQYAS